MTSPSAELLAELKALRKGRGVQTRRLGDQLGPGLRTVCEVDTDDTAVVRQQVTDRLAALAGDLPDELGLAATVALGVNPQAQQLFLGERMQWLAAQLRRDVRTARRRVDEAFARLAELGARQLIGPRDPDEPADATGEGWYVEKLQALVRLDRPGMEAIERRRIVAERPGVEQILVLITLPSEPGAPDPSKHLLAEVLYGGTLRGQDADAGDQFRYELELPAPLGPGQRHEYALLFRVPPDQPMRSHYLFVPTRRCELFDLHIRFDRARPPAEIRRVDALFHRAIDDERSPGEQVTLDRAGELHLQFHHPRPGYGYGARWRNVPGRR